MNANTVAHLAALATDSASTANERRIAVRLLSGAVTPEAGLLAGLSGADALDTLSGLCETMEGCALAIVTVAAAVRVRELRIDAHLDAIALAKGSGDRATARAGRALVLGMAA